MSARVAAYLRVVLYESDVELSPIARHLAEVLGHYADSTATAWPSIATLCKRTGYTDAKTIRKARRELVAAGVIAFEERRGNPGDPQSRNRYRFPIGMPLALSTDLPSDGRCAGGDTCRHTPRHLPSDDRDTYRQTAGTRSNEGSIEGAPVTVDDDGPVIVPAAVYERFGYLMGKSARPAAL